MLGAAGIGVALTLTADSYRPVVGALAVAAVVLLALGVVWPLAYWSVELRGRAQDAERLTERRIALITILALVGVGAAGLVFAATSLPIGSGIGTDTLGVVAAAVVLVIVAQLARPAM